MTRRTLPGELWADVVAMRQARQPVRVIRAWLAERGVQISPSNLWFRLRIAGIDKPTLPAVHRPEQPSRQRKTLRNQAVFEARSKGAKLRVIAEQFGLSKARVHSICLAWQQQECYTGASCPSAPSSAAEPAPAS